MDVYPAIDIRGGRVVRLFEGEAARETVYPLDPLAQAEAFARAGARWLHVVDLDRALGSGANNDALVRAICAAGPAVQLGGNVIDADRAARAVVWGAARVVLGAAAVLDPRGLDRLVAAVGVERVALAIDVRSGNLALRDRPPAAGPSLTPAAAVARARDAGIGAVVHRDLARDGLMAGADLDGAAALARPGVAVIAAGGVGALDDLRHARRLGLGGVIVGRALHDRRFTLAEALACSA